MSNKGKFLKRLVKDAPKFKFDFDGYGVKLYYKEGSINKSYAEIYTYSDILSIKVDGRTPSYGLMMHAAVDGDAKAIEGYVHICIRTIFDLASDEQFLQDVTNAITARNERMQEESNKQAAEITDDAEIAAQAFMESVVERSRLIGDKQYEEMASELEKERIKDALDELSQTGLGKQADEANREYVEPEFMQDKEREEGADNE